DTPAAAQAAVNIFTLKKADAVQTANLISQMFTGAGAARPATAGGPAFTPGAPTAAPGGGRTTITLAGNPTDGATLIDLRMSVDDRTNSIIVAGSRNVVVVPEAVSNTLLVSATPRYFADIMAMIDQIDAIPPQVVIQVVVAEVTLNDNQESGVEFGLQSPVVFLRGILPGITVNTTS